MSQQRVIELKQYFPPELVKLIEGYVDITPIVGNVIKSYISSATEITKFKLNLNHNFIKKLSKQCQDLRLLLNIFNLNGGSNVTTC